MDEGTSSCCHLAHVTNEPTEALNNLVKPIKRIGFGSATSRMTGFGRCSSPANRTGACWDRWWTTADGHPARFR